MNTAEAHGQLFGRPGVAPGVRVSLAADGARAVADGVDVLFGFPGSPMTRGGTDGDMLVLETGHTTLDQGSERLTLYVPLAWAVANLPPEAPEETRRGLAVLEGEARAAGRGAVWAFLAVGGVCLALMYGAWLAVDVALGKAIDKVPPSWEVALGQAASLSVTARGKPVTDPRVTGPVEEIVKRLVSGIPGSPYEFKVTVIKDSDVNAFALPGGQMFVLTGLLAKADGPEEVAGVLAHEVQHVLQRHGLKSVMRSLKFSLALTLLIGDMEGTREALVRQAAEFASLSHSRDAEREADHEGVKLLHRVGLDPEGMSRFFEHLAKESGTFPAALSILTTHPGHQERVANTRAWKAELGPIQARPLAVDWKKLQAALKEI